MSRLQADLVLVLTAFVWGTAFVAQSTAMDDLGPLSFVGIRFLIAGLAILPLVWFEQRRSLARQVLDQGEKPPSRMPNTGLLILTGFVFFLAAWLQQAGLVTTTATNAGFLTALYVVFVPFLVWGLWRRAPAPIIWLAASASFIGAFLLSGGTATALTRGDVLIILGAVMWAAHVVLVGIVVQRTLQPVSLAAWQFLIAGVIGMALGLVIEKPELSNFTGAWVEIGYTALISGALGFTLQAVAQRYTPATDAAIILSAEGVFAALAGAVILSEQLTLAGYVGAALIFTAILVVELVPKRKTPAAS